MENDVGEGEVSRDDGVFDIRGTKSKMCITRRLGRNVFGEVNGLNATVTRDSRTLITNLRLTVCLTDKLRLDIEGSERSKAR
jgi:hypothetical protein